MVEMEKKERMKIDAIRQRDKNHPGSINNRHILILYLFILFYLLVCLGFETLKRMNYLINYLRI